MTTDPLLAYDQHLANVAAAPPQADLWQPQDGALPSLFISHGAPPLLEDLGWMTELWDWARSMPKPKAILIVSAHWEHAPLSISSTAANTDVVYDFGGFAPRYFQMRYDTPDASELGRLVTSLMPERVNLHEHRSRGLDHGAWVPLKAMYPEADIPVVQLSLPTDDSAQLLELGARLRELRSLGVLVIGSGFMTHGLPFLKEWRVDAPQQAWSSDFDAWAADALARGAVDELSNFRYLAPGMPYAHPTVEHFIPLLVTLGASADPEAPVTTTVTGSFMGLSKRSFQAA